MPVLDADRVVAALRGAFAREVGRMELLGLAAERIRAAGAPYTSVYLWKNTVEKAKSFDTKAIQENAGGVTFDAPEGLVTIDGMRSTRASCDTSLDGRPRTRSRPA